MEFIREGFILPLLNPTSHRSNSGDIALILDFGRFKRMGGRKQRSTTYIGEREFFYFD